MQHFKLIYIPFVGIDRIYELKQEYYNDDKCMGFVYHNGRNCYILIDSEGTPEQQAKTLKHELAHLALNHLAKATPIDKINSYGDNMFGDGWIDREHEADEFAEQMTDAEFAALMQYAI